MNFNNPFALAGWSSIHGFNPRDANATAMSILPSNPTISLEDLPPLNRPSRSSVTEFAFTYFNTDITNCVVVGPGTNKYFDISTQDSQTIIYKSTGQAFATVCWTSEPLITIHHQSGSLSQRTNRFLELSRDGSYRIMNIEGRSYAWVPRENGNYLYNNDAQPPVEYARMRLGSAMTSIYLRIANFAFPKGLFEPCILATVLLFSGKPLD